MKKLLTSLAIVALLASASIFQTNTVKNTKLLAIDPPIVPYPPRVVNEKISKPVLIVTEFIQMSTTKLV